MSLDFSKRVLWFGKGDPTPLRVLLDQFGGFELLVVDDEQSLLDQLHSTRAAIFEFEGDIPSFIARIRRTQESLLANGVLIGLVDGFTDAETFQVAATRARVDTAYGPESSPFTQFQFFWKNWCLAAHRIVLWRPGPNRNDELDISGKIDPKHIALMRRAFSDFQGVQVRRLKGGASGAAVYCVTPVDQPRTPFLAKVDETGRIAGESDRYDKWIRKSVSFNNRPNLSRSRTVYSPTSSLLVEDFLDRCLPLSAVLPSSNPAVLIASVFEGAMRNWRRDWEVKRLKLAGYPYFEKILTRRDAVFLAAGQYAKNTLKSPYNGDELLHACTELNEMECTWTRIHGDLHAENLYVTASSSDVVLIDFYKSDTGPAVADPACLEVDLVFKRAKNISKALKLGLYKLPLRLPPIHADVGQDSIWLLDAVRAIRMIAISEPDRDAYIFAIACYLIRFASFEDNGSGRSRGLAVCIASRLIRSLSDAET